MYARFISNLKKQQPIKKVETRKKKTGAKPLHCY